MYSYQFKHFKVTSVEEVIQQTEKAIYLWIIHANKIPPHIGLSIDGTYYSLKVNGKDENLPVFKLLQIIENKKIGVFIVKWNTNTTLEKIQTVFSRYKKAIANQTSCLTPIRQIAGFEQERMILVDLLNKIEALNQLGEVFSLNLDADFKGILSYSIADIDARLMHLEDVKRNKNLPKSC